MAKPKKKAEKVRTGKRYRSGRADNHYDAIVIGSGIGGLANAAFLSLLGQKVCVLEQHYTAGGFTHAYEREGYEWDVGVHYIGEVHRPQSTLRRVFDVISEGRLEWAAMSPVYDRIILGDKQFDLIAGRENFISELSSHFPGEKAAIERYVELISKTSQLTPKFFAAQAMPRWMGRIYNNWIRPWLLPKTFFQTAREVLEDITDNQELISVLTGQWGDYGQTPRDAAFLMHALIAKHYLGGGAYPVGGAAAMARSIIPTIQKSGGEVFTYAEVKEVLIKNNAAYGVEMANGDKILADKIVSNAGFMNSVTRLLPEATQQKLGTQQWSQQVQRSSAHFCLYAGFKGDADALGLSDTNLWIYPNGDHEANVDAYKKKNPTDGDAEFPLLYMSFPSTKDPKWDERFPNKSTVEIVTITDMKWFEQWKGTTWQQRGEEYEAFKEQISQKLLGELFERLPQLKDALDYYELSTPLSTEFYQLNDQGEIYGLDHFVDRFNKPFLHPQTPVKNYYMTGSDIMTAGVGGALMAGLMTTCNMQGLRKSKEVMGLLKNYKSQAASTESTSEDQGQQATA
jgi:phytoene dehydrogenase-like protein